MHAQADGSKQTSGLATAGVKREASQAFPGGQPEPSPSSSQTPALPPAPDPAVTGPADEEGLAEFSRMLSVFAHCGRLKVVAQLLRPSNQHSSSILSSIEFDRDSEVYWLQQCLVHPDQCCFCLLGAPLMYLLQVFSAHVFSHRQELVLMTLKTASHIHSTVVTLFLKASQRLCAA